MSVLISNPERKKDRTDSDANDREVYVAGLARSVTKADLEKVFATVSLLVLGGSFIVIKILLSSMGL